MGPLRARPRRREREGPGESRKGRGRARVRVWAVVGLALLVVLAGEAASDSLSVSGAVLPSARYAARAVWDGTYAYVAGGLGPGCSSNSSYCKDILRYDPQADALTTAAVLPSGGAGMAAVWQGASVYLLGGVVQGEITGDQIVRYTPSVNFVETLTTRIPPREFASAVSDGSNIYVFGGCQRVASGKFEMHATILRYNPTNETVDVLNPKLPTPRCATSAVWDGQNAYVFGGRDASGRLDQIVKFSPASGSITIVEVKLSVKRTGSSAAWASDRAFVVGGTTGVDEAGSPLASVEVYTPATQTATVTSTSLPSGLSQVAAVWTGQSVHVFGGYQTPDRKVVSNQILRYTPSGTVSSPPSSSGDEFPPFPDSSSGAPAQPQNVWPRASFAHSVSGSTVYVDASASSDQDGTLVSYTWDWGDNTVAGVGKTAAHAYSAGGAYMVRLTVADDRGATDTTSQTVSVAPVANAPPAPSQPAPGSGSAGGSALQAPRGTPGLEAGLSLVALLASALACGRKRR